ncbi:hypothetical protein [uncultured Lamprocystis sp.]|jgi:hypothetical protein|uniref:hypothetical protein n=1 Tax=uncultured Lamprocystis sp. TaxID=543132 RepID=UPI0025DE208C|nr:hypothetical protein [uncultured Lamprocystis sp.]
MSQDSRECPASDVPDPGRDPGGTNSPFDAYLGDVVEALSSGAPTGLETFLAAD